MSKLQGFLKFVNFILIPYLCYYIENIKTPTYEIYIT